jgi:hypothetical protein
MELFRYCSRRQILSLPVNGLRSESPTSVLHYASANRNKAGYRLPHIRLETSPCHSLLTVSFVDLNSYRSY